MPLTFAFLMAAQALVLSNGGARIALDSQGRLVELVNGQTGSRYVVDGERPPWRMFYRSGDALDLEIEPDGQSTKITRSARGITLHYDSLIASLPERGRTRQLRAGLRIDVTLESDRLNWTALIHNREPGIEITEIWLPWINGIADMGRGREADVLYWPERGGRRIEAPYTKLVKGHEPPMRLAYPWPASMQWFTFNNGEEGLYFGSHDKTLMTSALNVMAQGRVMSASVIKYPFIKTGESWTSEPVVMRLYQGDWHEASRTYRAWADTWMEKPSPPEWVRTASGWAHPALGRKSQFGHIHGRYSDYPAMLKDARTLGLNTLIVFGWVTQGFDNRYPHYDPDETLGGAGGLKKAIADVRDAGGKIILYTQGQLIDPATEFYRTKGKDIVAKDVWGYEYREQYAQAAAGTFLTVMRNKFFGVACPGAKGWREQLTSQFDMVKGYGADGIIFDQMGGIPPYICFSADHPHARPSLAVGPEKVANMRYLRDAMRKRDPEFAFVIELATDVYAGLVDIIHSHGIGFWPAPDSFGEMFRYTFPEPAITNRFGGPYDKRRQYGHAFALGLRFDASTREGVDPAVGPFLTRLNEIRNTHSDVLLKGRFVDNEGFVCDNSRVSAHAFTNGRRLAVTLWNPGDMPQVARVIAPGYRLDKVEWQDPRWTGPSRTLQPGDVGVLIFIRE